MAANPRRLTMPWRELPHTADLLLEITAPSWGGLVAEATAALAAHLGEADPAAPRVVRELIVDGLDREELLVRWLTQTLVWYETEELLAANVELAEVSASRLRGRVTVAALRRTTGHVKAVTYHDLAVRETPAGWRVRIVFDL